ncbi:protein NYNRIN-like [Megalobrama amblycephala]|uniref:protein NYNRIN-like n=1 Tax=Megalobrama amblycephala TaxID=75352 RepID=UPI0020141D27|nr:protein NYNRIN-like [Megalobrama amblycephala]XP_048062280.1 protein NYNRIN-like [Megalobrama amblycephala]
MYSSKGFLNMPEYPLLVEGTMISFLVDSGATRSVLRPCDLPCEPALTNKTHGSLSVSGHYITERFTVPLKCETEGGHVLKHAFLTSKTCPVPLLGRDLMCKLNLVMVADPSGIVVKEGEQMYLKTEPKWVYKWHITETEWAKTICELGKNRTLSFGTDFMMPDNLHCTSHVVTERDQFYEKQWFEQKEDTLKLDQMFWTEKMCAISVGLSEKQLPLYLIAGECVPHISISKKNTQAWGDMGMFVKHCVETNDWEKVDETLEYSKKLRAFKSDCKHEIEVKRILTAVDKHTYENDCMTNICALDIHPALAEVPDELWAKHKYDVGLIKGCEPVIITPKSDYRPCQPQYPLKTEAILGIEPVFESLLKEGVIVPCDTSPVRTPIFPVKKIRDKGQPTEWRFVQDLQAVNSAVRARAATVPNPYTILSQIPQSATFFSVVDLANAFFSVPVDKDSAYWFAFNFKGKGYTFTRLCQGYCESPTIYNEALRRSLENLTLTPGSALLQYVDDILICAKDETTCVKDTVTLLQHLAQEGHKVSKPKLQFVKKQVTFLGHIISANSKSLSGKRVQAITEVPKPTTKKQMLSFLGMCSYCRTFIPNYAILEQPLRALTTGKELKSCDKINWTGEAEKAFADMKAQLATAPTLGLPVPTKPFVQMVDEKNGFMSSVLLQLHGDRMRPVGYFSGKLDPVAAGLPHCLRAVAAAEQAVMASREFVGYSDVTLMVPHAVSMILQEQKTSHLSTARWLRYHTILLDMPNITVKRCTVLNPATLLPTEEDGEEHHCCLTALEQICTPRPDLSDTLLENSEHILFVDGSAFRDPQTGLNKVGYAVTTEFETLTSGTLPSNFSAQAAELVALAEACKLMEGKSVTIYTDSRYAFGVAHDFGALWKHRNFLKSDGRPILNASLVSTLLDAILLPKQLAICKCAAHTNNKDFISTGNARADMAAKAAAARQSKEPECILLSETNTNALTSLQSMQAFATVAEKNLWRRCGCKLENDVWMSVDGKPCLPRHFFSHYAKCLHGRDHGGKGAMVRQMKDMWFTKGFTVVAENFCNRCVICNTHNVARGVKMPLASQPASEGPFEYLMMDFIELSPCEGKKYCLVMVDMWSKWVEVFPTSKQDAAAVAKALLTEIIPRWGIPRKISSDNGTHFVNEAIKQVGQFLGIDMRTHCSYHASSGGAVERENATIKNKLAKCCEDTGLTWIKALPIVLMYMRMRKRTRVNLSPFEIVFGRPPFMGMEGGKQQLPSTDLCEHNMLNYCKEMSSLLSDVCVQVKAAQGKPAETPLHNIKPGDYVVIRDLRRKSWKAKRWLGPFVVLLTTHTAVKVAERATWVHASHCRKVPPVIGEEEPRGEEQEAHVCAGRDQI